MAVDVVPTVIYSGMLGMTIFALIDTASKPKQRQTLFLAMLLSLLIIHILGELFIYSGAYQYAPGLAGAQMPLRMLLGPALYFYAHATMSPENHLPSKAYLVALCGPVLVIVGMIPFIFELTPVEKLALADPATRNPEHWKIALYTCYFAMFTFLLFTGAYLVVTLRLQAQHRKQLMERFSSIEKRSLDWFKAVLILWGSAWLLYALEFALGFMGLRWFGTGIVLPTLEAIILMVFAHLALKQPVLEESEKGNPTEQDNRRSPAIELSRMNEIAEKLNDAMQNKALFMEEELSLNLLSKEISVSENHISETLSQHLKTNFFQFVNGFRIEEAKKRLSNTESSITTIAFDVGFNSKSTFNSAFKKLTNTTPSAYRNSL